MRILCIGSEQSNNRHTTALHCCSRPTSRENRTSLQPTKPFLFSEADPPRPTLLSPPYWSIINLALFCVWHFIAFALRRTQIYLAVRKADKPPMAPVVATDKSREVSAVPAMYTQRSSYCTAAWTLLYRFLLLWAGCEVLDTPCCVSNQFCLQHLW